MKLDLVDGRTVPGDSKRFLEVGNAVVGDADRSEHARELGRFKKQRKTHLTSPSSLSSSRTFHPSSCVGYPGLPNSYGQ